MLTRLQLDVADLFFALPESAGFVVAGGAALLASHLVERPTDDLDLFAAAPTSSVTSAAHALIGVLQRERLTVDVVRSGQTFWRIVVRRVEEQTLVDLAIDSPPRAELVLTALGPTLAPLELAGRKLLALFGRAEARDFADVYLLARRFGRTTLLDQARAINPELDHRVHAQMMRSLTRLADDELPLAAHDVRAARAYFEDWARELG